MQSGTEGEGTSTEIYNHIEKFKTHSKKNCFFIQIQNLVIPENSKAHVKIVLDSTLHFKIIMQNMSLC